MWGHSYPIGEGETNAVKSEFACTTISGAKNEVDDASSTFQNLQSRLEEIFVFNASVMFVDLFDKYYKKEFNFSKKKNSKVHKS